MASVFSLYGFTNVSVWVPKTKQTDLLEQLAHCGCKIEHDTPNLEQYAVVIDCIFGFSFKSGTIRPPYDKVIEQFKANQAKLISVDAPSGQDIDGDVYAAGFVPAAVISLSAPKKCNMLAQNRGAAHYLAGNLVPAQERQKYGLQWLDKIWS